MNSSIKRHTDPFGFSGLISGRFFLIHFLRVVLYNNGIDLSEAKPVIFFRIPDVILFFRKKLNTEGAIEPNLINY